MIRSPSSSTDFTFRVLRKWARPMVSRRIANPNSWLAAQYAFWSLITFPNRSATNGTDPDSTNTTEEPIPGTISIRSSPRS